MSPCPDVSSSSRCAVVTICAGVYRNQPSPWPDTCTSQLCQTWLKYSMLCFFLSNLDKILNTPGLLSIDYPPRKHSELGVIVTLCAGVYLNQPSLWPDTCISQLCQTWIKCSIHQSIFVWDVQVCTSKQIQTRVQTFPVVELCIIHIHVLETLETLETKKPRMWTDAVFTPCLP